MSRKPNDKHSQREGIPCKQYRGFCILKIPEKNCSHWKLCEDDTHAWEEICTRKCPRHVHDHGIHPPAAIQKLLLHPRHGCQSWIFALLILKLNRMLPFNNSISTPFFIKCSYQCPLSYYPPPDFPPHRGPEAISQSNYGKELWRMTKYLPPPRPHHQIQSSGWFRRSDLCTFVGFPFFCSTQRPFPSTGWIIFLSSNPLVSSRTTSPRFSTVPPSL